MLLVYNIIKITIIITDINIYLYITNGMFSFNILTNTFIRKFSIIFNFIINTINI